MIWSDIQLDGMVMKWLVEVEDFVGLIVRITNRNRSGMK